MSLEIRPERAQNGVAILGVFVADLVFSAIRLPILGETLKGAGFQIGPGGKGSNQAVAASRAGADVSFITRLGRDAFGAMVRKLWTEDGIAAYVTETDTPTGAAFVYVNSSSGENAIIIVPGAAADLTAKDVDAAEAVIAASKVFVTQLEQPVAAAQRGLEIARAHSVTTVFNPAPAEMIPDAIYPLCDFIVPNEAETSALTGLPVASLDDARRAGDALLSRGVGVALITLGERGALFHARDRSVITPAYQAGQVVDTTGAGDAFIGSFAAALAGGEDPIEAVRFGCAAAGLSVMRRGTAHAMPHLREILGQRGTLPPAFP